MFGTSIHWTTFFYLLIDTFLVLFVVLKSPEILRGNLKRYLILGCLYVAYNLTGGFLPMQGFPGPFILQYVITYSVAIAMCLYVVYYFYKEYDIDLFAFRLGMSHIVLVISACFFILFLLPYFLTGNLDKARAFFTLPVAVLCMIIFWGFLKKIASAPKPNAFIKRRNQLSLIALFCIAMLPIMTVIGDYQWLTFTVVNTAFYIITAIEIDRHLFFLQEKSKFSTYLPGNASTTIWTPHARLFSELTRREIEIAISMLDNKSYKEIGEDLFIAESTVSKHASNIFRKVDVKNRTEFQSRYMKSK